MNRLYFFTLIFIFVLFAKGEIYACNITSFNVPSEACIGTTVNVTASGQKTPGCPNEVTQKIEVDKSPAGANPMKQELTSAGNDVNFRFDKVGTYTLKYTFSDGCSPDCIELEEIVIVNPEASFVQPSIKVCEGSGFSINVNLDNATTATVRTANGAFIRGVPEGAQNGIGTLNFELPVTENFKLYISRAVNENYGCENVKLFDSLLVQVVPLPGYDIISGPDCDATGDNYTMTLKLRGGDRNYSLLTLDEATLKGDTLITNFKPSGAPLSIIVNTGTTCGEFVIDDPFICECTAFAGEMPLDRVTSCFDDTVVFEHDTMGLFARPSDQLLYILHSGVIDTLGTIYGISENPEFSLPAPNLADSVLYVSALVGPYEIPENLEDFDLTTSSCYNLTFGTPISWLRKEEFDIIGATDVCVDEKNRMYELSITRPFRPNNSGVFINGSESKAFIESANDERAFISFPEQGMNNMLYYQTQFILAGGKTCTTVDSISINVGSNRAPEESNIILWPGNIFASTSDGPCYQWGSVNKFGDFEYTIFPGANEKFYYSETNISATVLEENAFFVAIFDSPNCEFSFDNCNSIIFYNQNLLPGLGTNVQDDFSLDIYPNPSDGQIKLEINGSFRGLYKTSVYTSTGVKVFSNDIDKKYNKSVQDINISKMPTGVYFIEIINELGQREMIKTIKI